jgi:ribonuclease HII
VDRVHIGIDENGLGARLGPLIVTAVAGRIGNKSSSAGRVHSELGHAHLLDDSKRLVSHQDVRLGEAWARAILGASAKSPAELLERVSIDPVAGKMQQCPSHVRSQCWADGDEGYTAGDQLVAEVGDCLSSLAKQGLSICLVRSVFSCTKALNDELGEGRHRFAVDLHCMERLILDVHERVGIRVDAVCGKVGGIADYPRFFGPLAGRLHTVVQQDKARGVYEFAELGRIAFEQDADARDPLVMIASLVGKYIRELFMARIARRYAKAANVSRLPSGYHDPITDQFVEASAILRTSQRIPLGCFERRRNT